MKNDKSTRICLEDNYVGKEEMEGKVEERYLGDIISNDGKNMKNFKARVTKAIGIIRNIMTRLDGIPFGKYYFEVAIILRNSLLVSSILCNCEVWYNISDAEMKYLETADILLLRLIGI